MTTISTVIQAAIPNADEALCDHVLWGCTPFPCGPISAQMLYKAASRVGRAAKNKIQLCDFCPNKAETGKWECSRCAAMFQKAREQEDE